MAFSFFHAEVKFSLIQERFFLSELKAFSHCNEIEQNCRLWQAIMPRLFNDDFSVQMTVQHGPSLFISMDSSIWLDTINMG